MKRTLAIALGLVALPAAAGADGNTGIVRGHVFAAGAPVCGALIAVVSNMDRRILRRSDENGFFVFLAVMPGISRVVVDGAASSGGSREVQVSPNLTTEVNLSVDAAGAARAVCKGASKQA